MKNFLKSKIVTAVIIIATLALAGIAVFTAIRIYQLRKQPVAPTAPESKPKAQEETAGGACGSLTFNISATPTPPAKPACLKKEAYRDNPDLAINDGGLVDKENLITSEEAKLATASVAPGEIIVFFIPLDVSGVTTTSYRLRDIINTNLDYIEASKGCTYQAAASGLTPARTVTCSLDSLVTTAAGDGILIRVKVKTTADSNSTITNQAIIVSGDVGFGESCGISFIITTEATPTPTPPPYCDDDCNSEADCPGDLICYQGFCRNEDCTSESDCICPTATESPSPTPTSTATTKSTAAATASPTPEGELPEAGISLPTIIGVGAGIILLIASIALAL